MDTLSPLVNPTGPKDIPLRGSQFFILGFPATSCIDARQRSINRMTFVWQRAAWRAANAKCFFASGLKQLHTFWSEPAHDDRQAAVVTQEDQLVADREAIVGGLGVGLGKAAGAIATSSSRARNRSDRRLTATSRSTHCGDSMIRPTNPPVE
jgi:hypothetical protein